MEGRLGGSAAAGAALREARDKGKGRSAAVSRSSGVSFGDIAGLLLDGRVFPGREFRRRAGLRGNRRTGSEHRRSLQFFGVHHGRDSLECAQHRGLLPFLELRKLVAKTVLEGRRGVTQKIEPPRGDLDRNPATVHAVSNSGYETSLFQPIDNPGHGRVADVHGTREGTYRGMSKTRKHLQRNQLRSCYPELVDQLPRMQIDGTYDSPQRGDDSFFKS